MGTLLVLASVCLALVGMVHGDCYMQNPPGCNNRLDEARRPRRNGNRMFDSQNNNRGGYNVGRALEFYVGSTLRIEWTNQHSCGNVNNNCELIAQYFCDEKIRDGSTTKTIPDHHDRCENNDCNKDLRFGMHEDFEYYETCRYTYGNKRVFKADQKLRGHTAKYTRQNRQGTRRAYECPEERDYYPYWRPTVWKDIVIMTNNVERCDYYQKHSQNVEDRYYCKVPPSYMTYLRAHGDRSRRAKYIPINQEDCEKIEDNGEKGEWVKHPKHDIPAPDCIPSPKNRGNHNGNTVGGETNFYNWIIPEDIHSQCVLRMRYNISTNDFNAWNTTAHDNSAPIYKNMGLADTQAEEMGYVFKGNPEIHPIWELLNGQNVGKEFELRLAINTAQFGRTFQDRSHAFSIRARPANISADATIYNVNVRGKRGNIVQTYPATEYDYAPETLNVTCETDYIHFQWTGANSNPNNNAGQGRRQTDRSNICKMGVNKYVKEGDNKAGEIKHGHYGGSFPAKLYEDNFLGLDDESVAKLCSSGHVNGDNIELDDAGVYYNHRFHKPENGGLVQCKCEFDDAGNPVTSVWYYMCTRNNNFTNRSQKGKIICLPKPTTSTTAPAK